MSQILQNVRVLVYNDKNRLGNIDIAFWYTNIEQRISFHCFCIFKSRIIVLIIINISLENIFFINWLEILYFKNGVENLTIAIEGTNWTSATQREWVDKFIFLLNYVKKKALTLVKPRLSNHLLNPSIIVWLS